MGNIVELKPKSMPQQQLTCPDCDGHTWQVVITRINIEGKVLNHTDMYCQTEGCEFYTPAVLILPEDD